MPKGQRVEQAVSDFQFPSILAAPVSVLHPAVLARRRSYLPSEFLGPKLGSCVQSHACRLASYRTARLG